MENDGLVTVRLMYALDRLNFDVLRQPGVLDYNSEMVRTISLAFDPQIYIGALKLYLDGLVENRTAWRLPPDDIAQTEEDGLFV